MENYVNKKSLCPSVCLHKHIGYISSLQSGFHIQGNENIGTLCSFYTGVFHVQYLPVTDNIDVIDWKKD